MSLKFNFIDCLWNWIDCWLLQCAYTLTTNYNEGSYLNKEQGSFENIGFEAIKKIEAFIKALNGIQYH